MERIYVAKQEKGYDITSIAYQVANMLYKDPSTLDVEPTWSNEDEYAVSLADRYWEVRITTDTTESCPITRENANCIFEIGDDYVIGLKEVYMIM